MKKVKVAILGFGGIAHSHLKGYRILEQQGEPVELVALCDINPEQFTKEQKINLGSSGVASLEGMRLYYSADELLEKGSDIDMVDICLPSFLHCEYAVKMLRAGKHVLSEKPMGLSSAQCAAMISAAEASGKRLMIGQCLRFDTVYAYLKQLVAEKTYGAVKHAHFFRYSALPKWGFERWYRDTERSGGCALDMHIHDVDMVRYLFGEPKAVSAVSTTDKVKWQVINSRFFFDDGKLVVADGSWDEGDAFSFSYSYRVRFERAELICEKGKLTLYEDGKEQPREVDPGEIKNHMAEEIRCMIHTILGQTQDDRISPREASKTVALVERLRESADQNGAVLLF